MAQKLGGTHWWVLALDIEDVSLADRLTSERGHHRIGERLGSEHRGRMLWP